MKNQIEAVCEYLQTKPLSIMIEITRSIHSGISDRIEKKIEV